MRKYIKITVHILFAIVCIATVQYSLEHFNEHGCDGGLCGLALLFIVYPTMLGWLLLWFALLSLYAKSRFWVLLVSSIVVNGLVLLPLLESDYLSSYLSSFYLVAMQVAVGVLFGLRNRLK